MNQELFIGKRSRRILKMYNSTSLELDSQIGISLSRTSGNSKSIKEGVNEKMQDKSIQPEGEEYVVEIPRSFASMTRQRFRAAERAMTYTTLPSGQRLCEVVLISKRTKSKRKRTLKRKEAASNSTI